LDRQTAGKPSQFFALGRPWERKSDRSVELGGDVAALIGAAGEVGAGARSRLAAEALPFPCRDQTPAGVVASRSWQPGSLATTGGDRRTVISRDRPCLLLGPYEEELPRGLAAAAGGCMTHQLHETLSDQDFRNLARLISACTLGLWAFAAGLLIGTFLFS